MFGSRPPAATGSAASGVTLGSAASSGCSVVGLVGGVGGRLREHLLVAARQDLAHRGVVVAGRDAGDVVAAVFARLHLVMVIDHARRLRRLAHRVADVEALDTQLREVVHLQAERFGERARARLLRALFGEQARERELRVLFGHREPDALLPLRLAQQCDLVSGLLDQQIDEFAARRRVAHDQHRRHPIAEVMLRDERLQHFRFERTFPGSDRFGLGLGSSRVRHRGQPFRAPPA